MRHILIPALMAGLALTACSKKAGDQTETIVASSYAPVSTDAGQGGAGQGAAAGAGFGAGGPGFAPPQTQTLQDMLARAGERFDRLDLNHDGKLTKDELDQARAQFQARRQAEGGPPPGAGGGFGGPGGPGGMLRADKNGDGVVTRQEWEDQTRERFARMDADKNGAVTREEMQAAFQALRRDRPGGAPAPSSGPGGGE